MVTRLTAVGLAALFGLLGPVAVAHADDTDAQFLAALRAEGISDHLSPADVANDVLNSSSMPAYHAGYFVGASIKSYCPQHLSKLDG